jgi:hypothetical protein
MKTNAIIANLKQAFVPDLHFWTDFSAITSMSADLFWIVIMYQVLVLPPAGWQPSVFLLVLNLFGSNILSRVLLSSKASRAAQIAILGIFAFLLVFSSYQMVFYSDTPFSLRSFFSQPYWSLFSQSDSSGEFWHLVFVLGLFWRGVVLSTASQSNESPHLSFTVGIILFLIYGIFFQWENPGYTYTCFFAFLFFALGSMGTGKIAAVGSDRMGKLPAYHPHWLFWIAGISFILVVISLLAGWLFSSPLTAFINQLFILLYLIFIVLIILILYLITWILSRAFPYLQSFFSNLGEEGSSNQTLQDYINQFTNGTDENSLRIIQIFQSLRPWFLVTMIGINVRNLRKRRLLSMDDSEPAQPLFPFQRKSNWRNGREIKNRRSDWMAAAKIRRIYTHLLELTSRLGEPRGKSLTPFEYLPKLIRTFPEESVGLTHITGWYNAIRYGELPETNYEVEMAEAVWSRIEAQGKTMLEERKQVRKSSKIN